MNWIEIPGFLWRCWSFTPGTWRKDWSSQLRVPDGAVNPLLRVPQGKIDPPNSEFLMERLILYSRTVMKRFILCSWTLLKRLFLCSQTLMKRFILCSSTLMKSLILWSWTPMKRFILYSWTLMKRLVLCSVYVMRSIEQVVGQQVQVTLSVLAGPAPVSPVSEPARDTQQLFPSHLGLELS